MALCSREEVTLYYEREGAGPPVLLIQGVGVPGQGWRPQIAALSRRYETVCFDNRGVGRSGACRGAVTIEAMADDARLLLDEVGWNSAHVVGHSMGGVIAQQLALDHRSRVRSLALLCTFGRGRDAARVTPWVLWMTLRMRLGTRRARRRAFLEMLYSPGGLRAGNPDELAERVGALMGRDLADTPRIAWKQLAALGRHDASARLGELSGIPTLVLSAEGDRIAPPKLGRELAAAIPGATFEAMAGAAHGLPIEFSEALNQRLDRFLAAAEEKPMGGRVA